VLQEKQKKIVAVVVDIQEEMAKISIKKEAFKKQETELIHAVEMAILSKNEC
jgi:hypothetical protein